MSGDERQSPAEEAAILQWWNDLSTEERELFVQSSGSQRPSDAWFAWEKAAMGRAPRPRDVRVALVMLGGTSSVAALSSGLRRRHPRASGVQVHGAVHMAIQERQIFAHEGLLHSQQVRPSPPSPQADPETTE